MGYMPNIKQTDHEAVAHSSFKSLNFVRLFGNEIKFQAIEEVG